MRAAVLTEVNKPLQILDLEQEGPKAGEVRVEVKAAGVCMSDWHIMNGDWPLPLPMVLGHEAAGVVVELGAGVTNVKKGDHVIFSFRPHCGHCAYCSKGRTVLCSGRNDTPRWLMHDGTARVRLNGEPVNQMARIGTFSEHVVCPAEQVVAVRKDLPWTHAAIIGCSVATGVGAVVRHAQVEAGATVLVVGCGGVGLNVVQGARLAGATTIVAVDVKDGALAFAQKFGATHVVNARTEDAVARVQALTGGGVHYAFEAYGSGATTKMAVDMLRKRGTAVIVGIAPIGDTAAIEPVVLTRGEKTVTGTYYGSAHPRQDMPRIADWVQRGRLDVASLVTRRYALADINRAYEDIDTDAVGRGVIVFP
jgi:S-(hydroxymethyl)glutathione dehydrogenase / alcohol dehydrogenase